MAKTPSFEEVIELAINSKMFNMHTCLPAKVERFDVAKSTVDVKPSLKRKYRDGLFEYPLIQNVPVMFPKTSKFSLDFPIVNGDEGFLVFSERSLDVWKKQGGIADPNDPRKFDLTDCVFFPGGTTTFKPIAGGDVTTARLKVSNTVISLKENGEISLKNGQGEFKLTSDGKIKFQGATDEFMDLFIQTLEQLVNAQTAAGPLLNKALFQVIKTKAEALKG